MRCRRGLTLLEIVLAMAVFSIVMVASYSVLFTGMKIYAANVRSIEEQRALRHVFMRIDQDVRRFDGNAADVIVEEDGTLAIGDAISYFFHSGAGTVERDDGVNAAAIASHVQTFTAEVDAAAKSIRVTLTGRYDHRTVESVIHLRNSTE